jgi:hypothetical protein
MRKLYYLTSFRKKKLSEQISGHMMLIPDVNMTNDAEIKRRYLTPEFAAAAGGIDMACFERASNLVFGEFDERHVAERPPDAVLLGVLLWINDLFKNAWLYKDHAMECDAAYLRIDDEQMSAWFSNFLAIKPSSIPVELRPLDAWVLKEFL